jgi:selenide,water dikinase
VIGLVFRGGLEKLREAGVALLGGHTVADDEIKFGYAITGEIDPTRIWTNAGARVGDRLVLTKPLGTGIIATAIKFARASPEQIDVATRSMTRLNRAAADAARRLPIGDVSACTDITGFGLAGHASEMAAASGVSLLFDAAALPVLAGAEELAAENRSGGSRTNEAHFSAWVGVGASVPDALRLIVFDPQTSGGLLVAVRERSAGALIAEMRAAEVDATEVGRVVARESQLVLIA